MLWSSWFVWVGRLTPMKFFLWLGNRVTTWLGMFHVWKRFRSRRLIWVWLLLMNAASFGVLVFVFVWLKHR